jgi:TrmH RNA methyltransferase
VAAEAATMKPDTICGLHPVTALFRRRGAEVQRLFYLPALREAVGPFCAELAKARRPYRMVEADELEKIAGTPHHGGVVAVARPRVPAILDPAQPPRDQLLLVLDGIASPHVLGAIARAAAFFGVKSLLLGEGLGHAMPSDAAHRASDGGLERLALYRTRDLPRALTLMQPHYRTVAASHARDAPPLADLPRDRPVALVLGHEERGISEPVLAACRRQVRVAGPHGQSLNRAQEAAVLLQGLA